MTEAQPPATPRILIDADACPVKEETLRVAQRYRLAVVIVSNGGLRPSRDPLVSHVVVPREPDAADDWIVDHAATGDIVVTADVLLAARCVEKEVTVVGPDGRRSQEHRRHCQRGHGRRCSAKSHGELTSWAGPRVIEPMGTPPGSPVHA